MPELALPRFLATPAEGATEPAAHLDLAVAPAGVCALSVPLAKQEMDNWCWAAVTAAIEAYYQEPFAETQCQVATRWLGEKCCPPTQDKTSPLQNSMYDLVTALRGNAAGGALGGQFQNADLRREVDAKRPLCCILGKGGVPSHVILAVGYTDGGDIILNDPACPGLQFTPLGAFRTTYAGGGTWMDSLMTQKV
jgi:hypothetical protein